MPNPLLDPTHLSRLILPNVETDLKYVGDAITLTRHKLEGKVPLIGFSGAPVNTLIYFKEIKMNFEILELKKHFHKLNFHFMMK